jgi:hypothetical protein
LKNFSMVLHWPRLHPLPPLHCHLSARPRQLCMLRNLKRIWMTRSLPHWYGYFSQMSAQPMHTWWSSGLAFGRHGLRTRFLGFIKTSYYSTPSYISLFTISR